MPPTPKSPKKENVRRVDGRGRRTLTNNHVDLGVVTVEKADSVDNRTVFDDAGQSGTNNTASVHLKVAYPEGGRTTIFEHLLKVDA